MVRTCSFIVVSSISLLVFAADKVKTPTIERADQTYKSAIAKAQNEFDRARSKAVEVKLKAYRDGLAAATRSGDFDAASALKALIAEIEAGGGAVDKRQKPKETIKFANHEYAIIRDHATWHMAKRYCEEMGGHLVTINGPDEDQFLQSLLRTNGIPCWLGATDEVEEGKWVWVDGTTADSSKFSLDNYNQAEHSLYYVADQKIFADLYSGSRIAYACEWD